MKGKKELISAARGVESWRRCVVGCEEVVVDEEDE